MEILKNRKVILWDFDGVIIDSMPTRERGFIQVLSNYPKDKVDLLLKFHNENGGLSRYVKFKYFFSEILNITITDDDLKRILLKFSSIMREALTDKNLLINDVNKFISNNYNSYKMHIVSGSDEIELNYLCNELGISKFFTSIHGSPTSKNDLVRNLLKCEKYSPNSVCLIGDSINDYDAALANNIEFFGYNNPALRDKGLQYIESFK